MQSKDRFLGYPEGTTGDANGTSGPDAVLGLEGTRRTGDAGEADNQLMLRLALRF